MLNIQLFYDNFTAEDVAGLFSLWHFAFLLIFAALLVGALFCFRRSKGTEIQKFLWRSAIIVSIVEAIKIVLRIAKGGGTDTWIPLYYCSLFLYAIWMTRCKKEWLSRMGYSYITMGGIMAACLFTLYPSTSLAIYPALHPASLHSFLYHFLMALAGILILWKKQYTPKAQDSLLYFAFVFTACVVGYFVNERTGSNCMFLHNAFKLPIIDDLLQYSHALYILVVVLAQAVGLYWFNLGLYTLVKKRKEKK
jgi:uncharacterized membrane protein YwaF